MIVILRAFVAAAFAESLTWTVKLLVPMAVGVPVITPAGSRASPAGSAPVVIDQCLPSAPPEAARVWEYAVPVDPAGRDVVVMVRAGGLMVMLRAFVGLRSRSL